MIWFTRATLALMLYAYIFNEHGDRRKFSDAIGTIVVIWILVAIAGTFYQ